MTNAVTDLMRAFIKNAQLEQVGDYARRGRLYHQLSDSTLKDRWETAFRRWCQDASDLDKRRVYEDLEAELCLRGIDVPLDRVEDALEILYALTDKQIAEARSDPTRWHQIGENLKRDLLDFARDLDEETEN